MTTTTTATTVSVTFGECEHGGDAATYRRALEAAGAEVLEETTNFDSETCRFVASVRELAAFRSAFDSSDEGEFASLRVMP